MKLFKLALVSCMVLGAAAQPSAMAQTQEMVDMIKDSAKKYGVEMTDEEARAEAKKLALEAATLNARVNALTAAGNPKDAASGVAVLGALLGSANTRNIPALPGAAYPAPAPTPAPAATQPANRTTHTELQAKLPAHVVDNQPFVVNPKRDGLMVNGRIMLDSSGQIIDADFDGRTGAIGYFAARSNDEILVRLSNGKSSTPPITVASLRQNGNSIIAQTVTGEEISGDVAMPAHNGFLVSRGSSVFHYVAGQGLNAIAIPDGWRMAERQRGAVGSTKTVLLEATKVVGGIGGDLRSIGSAFGTNKTEDYALFNIETQALYPLSIDRNDKEVNDNKYSGCTRRAGGIVNTCSNVKINSYESLFEPDGSVNSGHYFWAVDWYVTEMGPYAIAYEGGKKISAINLASGARTVLRKRNLGIGDVVTSFNTNGKMRVEIQRGFSGSTIEDVEAEIRSKQAANSAP